MAEEVKTISRFKNILMGIFSALAVIAFGLVLLLAAVGRLGALDAGDVWLPALLFMLGSIFLFNGLLSDSSIMVWLGALALCCGIIVVIEVNVALSYKELYPLFIAAPGIASLVAMPLAESKVFMLKAFLFFVVIAGIFALSAADRLPIWGVIAVCIVLVGVFMLINVLVGKGKKWDDPDNK